MNPVQIERWLERNAYKLTNSVQFLGDEPNTLQRDWDGSSLRWLVVASWPYEHAAGNQSIPYVAKAVTDASPGYLCDRFYLPATPRDMRLLERGGVPVFGIESKHQLRDFDVVGTSISYLVLLMNFMKMLSMSGMPLRWKDREANAGDYPMVIIGGQAYSAPGAMEPVADCIWLGEADTEPGNGGMDAVCARIGQYKAEGLWSSDRTGCYRKLALEFSYLHFPRFVRTSYRYEDRGMPHASKQVSGYASMLPGMAFPRRARKVRNMDRIAPLDKSPLLYADPALGAGDLEVARGSCAAKEFVLIRGQGMRQLASWRGDALHPHDGDLGVLKADAGGELADVSHVLMNGEREMVTVTTVGGHRVTCTPDHEISVVRGPAVDTRKAAVRGAHGFSFSHGRQGKPSRLEVLGGRPREFVRADELVLGDDYIPVYYGQNVWAAQEQLLDIAGCYSEQSYEIDLPEVLDEDVAWLLGMLAGDVSVRNASHHYLRIQAEDPGVAARTAQVLLRLFGRDVEPWTRDGARPGRQTFEVRSAALSRWLKLNFGISDNRNRRRVPDLILRSPRHIVAAYLSGFYDSDGTYDARNGRPSWCSGSEDLIRVVSLMLLNLGAPCSWQRKSTAGRHGSAPGFVWSVQGLQAPDGDWSWLLPSHTRRLVHLRRWQETCSVRNGREACAGVIYTPVATRVPAGTGLTYDLAVPELSAFTCSGILVHNCPAWCSFCRLSWLTKPYRQRSVDLSVEHAAAWCRNMGAVETSPFAPDFPMHTERKELIARLLTEVSDELDSVAMRVDDAISDSGYWMLASLGGMDAVTLGLEGNSQRMRDLVGKGTSDREVEEAVTRAIQAGIRKIKLFMITNLPGEEPGDVMRIVRLAERLAGIRDSLGQPNVQIQFSWTPLLIEAGTPFQWFAPTPPDHTLIKVADLFKGLKIAFKIGTKAEPNKLALFQLCQRASADVGEAIVDVLEALDIACWGGVPRDMQERLDTALRARGFANGFADCFDERSGADLFGWEYIDTGVSRDLLYRTYRQMVEFLENTEAETYDELLGDAYRGQEFVARCDTQCMGATCGVCSGEDLKLRSAYIAAGQREQVPDLSAVRPVDQSTVAQKVLVRVRVPPRFRFVDPDHWRFSLRRAAYQVADIMSTRLPSGFSIAKRSIRLVSDGLDDRGVSGDSYIEFGLTRELDELTLQSFLEGMGAILAPWLALHEGHAVAPRFSLKAEAGASLYSLTLHDDPDLVIARLRAWERQDYIKAIFRKDTSYFNVDEEVNARDCVDDMWLRHDGSAVTLRMLSRGPLGPYQLGATLMGQRSWIEAMAFLVPREDVFLTHTTGVAAVQGDLLRPPCTGCGGPRPQNMAGLDYDPDRCPRCLDAVTRKVLAGLGQRAGV